MNAENYFTIGIIFLFSGAIVSLIIPREVKKYSYILSAVGSLSLLISGVYISSGVKIYMPPIHMSSLLEFAFRGDSLSGFFVTVISILALAVSIYSVGYTENIKNKGLMGFLYNLFILSMYAVILSGNIITFLISWETMSVVSYFLVTFDRDEKSAKAGLLYAVMTHIGTAFIIALFFILYKYTGHMDFPGMKASTQICPLILNHSFLFFR